MSDGTHFEVARRVVGTQIPRGGGGAMAGGDIGERYDIVHPLVTQAVVPPQTGAPMGGAASMAGGGDVGLSFHRDQATGAVKIDKDRADLRLSFSEWMEQAAEEKLARKGNG